MPSTASAISAVLGWGYFLAWSVSFWPQVILNFRRKSVAGLSLDFTFYNIIGFSCYAAYTLSFYLSAVVQGEFKLRNNGRENLVAPNDVFFAVHAWVFTVLTGAQVLYYREPNHRLSSVARVILPIMLSSITGFFIWTAFDLRIRALDFLYFLGTCKLITSLIKYLPQMYLNFRDKSTEGWSIHNILLDATGGILSLAQLFVDAWITAHTAGDTSAWAARALSGNGTKLGLAALSLVFDSVFLVQHFWLYRGRARPVGKSGGDVEKKLGDRAEKVGSDGSATLASA